MNSKPILSTLYDKPPLYYFSPNHTDYNSDLDLGGSEKSDSDYDEDSQDLTNNKPELPPNAKVLRFEDVISANKNPAPEKLNSGGDTDQDESSTDEDSEDDLVFREDEKDENAADFEVRNYQEEIRKRIIENDENTILFLETGAGKTIISILVIHHYLRKFPSKKVVFLAPTQNLVEQQKRQIQKTLHMLTKSKTYKERKVVFSIHGEKSHRGKKFVLTESLWKSIQVLIISPQTFLNLLRKNRISLDQFSLIVFDECHHTQELHPYNQIMQEFYFHGRQPFDKPKILGLTASPIDRSQDFDDLKKSFDKLKKNLDSNFLALPLEVQEMLPKNKIEAKTLEYQNIGSQQDLLEIAKERGFYEFFKSVNIEGVNYLHNRPEYQQIKEKENQITSSIMKTLWKRTIDLFEKEGLVILLELGPHAFYKSIESFQEGFYSVRADQILHILPPKDREIFLLIESFLEKFLKSIAEMKAKNQISKKLEGLLRILSQCAKADDDQTQKKIIIFARERYIARLLNEYINQFGSPDNSCLKLKSKYITGQGNNSKMSSSNKHDIEIKNIEEISFYLEEKALPEEEKSVQKGKSLTKELEEKFGEPLMSIDRQMDTVQNFRDGEFNVLISTSVAEEGFDIPACNVVVTFNEPDSLKSYIQMQGRARANNSTFYILTHESNKRRCQEKIEKFEGTKIVLRKYAYDCSRLQKTEQVTPGTKLDLKQKVALLKGKGNFTSNKKEDIYYKYTFTKSGYLLNTNYSIDLLTNLCCSSYNSRFIDLKPKYKIFKIPSLGYLCYVILPAIFSEFNMQTYKSNFSDNIKDSQKLAAYKCCLALYERGIINEQLKLQTSKLSQENDIPIQYIFEYLDGKKDPTLLEKFKKMKCVRTTGNKLRLMCPLTTLNPFKSQYYEDGPEEFAGSLYKLEFTKDLSDDRVKRMPADCSLGFIFFNEKLDNAEIKVELPKDDQARVRFRKIGEHCFNKKEYEKLIKVSRFLDATVRSWDVWLFEMLSGKSLAGKGLVSRTKKVPNGVSFDQIYEDKEEEKPVYPVYVMLNDSDDVDYTKIQEVLSYIEKMEKRCQQITDRPLSEQKIKIDRDYAEKFATQPEKMSQVLVQNYLTFDKFIVQSYHPVTKIDLLDLKTEGASLQMRLITSVEPYTNYEINQKDYVLKMKSLGRYCQKLIKGEEYQNAKEAEALKKDHYGVLGEFIEFPLQMNILIQAHQFKLALSNLRDYLRSLYFRDEILVEIERNARIPSAKLTWNQRDLHDFQSIGQFILENSCLKQEERKISLSQNLDYSSRKPLPSKENNTSSSGLYSTDLPMKDLILSLSTKEYNNQGNYDREEMLGDTILKLLSTIEIFAKYPTADENKLHLARTEIINNKNLFKHAIKHEIYQFILKRATPELPISYIKIQEESTPDSKEDLPPNYHEFNYKTIADVIEAMIAVYYNHGGLFAAQRFLYMIGVLEHDNFLYSMSKLNSHQLDDETKIFKKFIENRLRLKDGKCYNFRDVNLLIQAFSHHSIKTKMQAQYLKLGKGEEKEVYLEEGVNEKDSKIFEEELMESAKKINQVLSYDRLEFLGDSILDYYVVNHFYHAHPTATSGDLTQRKSLVVNNHTLSLVCIKNEFDKALLSNGEFGEQCNRIRQKMEYYLENMEEYMEVGHEEFIKVCGDMIEALIGAIYLDCEQDMDITFEIIEGLCGEMIEKFSSENALKKNPEYLVKEYFKKKAIPMPTIRKLKSKEMKDKSAMAEYVLESERKEYARYQTNTSLEYQIEKSLYARACKNLKLCK